MSFASVAPSELAQLAQGDQAYRYALMNLNAFAVTGIAYDRHNTNGELDLYNPSTGTGSMSTQYLADRAAMLAGVIRARVADSGSGNALTVDPMASETTFYKDMASDITLRQGQAVLDCSRIVFGSVIGNDVIAGGSQADHLYGMGGNDVLTGNQGNDYLEGGKGSDTLIGGKGDDILEGGEGIDTYVINSGDGHDIIIDDGRNILVIDGKTFAGVFVKQEGSNSYVFTSDDATYTMTFNSPGTLTLDGSTSINFLNQTSAADFADGDFGIRLQEAPPETNRVLTGTAYRDEMSIFETGADQANWELQFTSFPDLNPNTPFYQQPLTAVAPRLQVTGGDSGDYLFGFARHDEIAGGAGDDIIQGNIISWNNKLLILSGNLEGDLLDGGSGNDWVGGSGGADQISGGDGDDLLSGYNDVDSISGDQGNDILVGGSHADVLTGGIGDDILSGDGYFTHSNLNLDNLGSLSIQKTASSDGYYTAFTTTNYAIRHDAPNSGDDILLGGAGRDLLFGGNGADILDGGTESDSLFGGDGADCLYGGDGNDWLVGDNGDLTGSGNDTLDGGSGDDLLYGLSGDDALFGNDGADELQGFSGNDSLFGDSGDDTLAGGEGQDILGGGVGTDYLNGGAGDDTYVFCKGCGVDSIHNYADDWATATDIVVFSGGITLADLDLIKEGNNLRIALKGTADALVVERWFLDDSYKIDQFKFADGSILTADQFEATGCEIYGGAGDDELYGGIGNDSLSGGEGNDNLNGEKGQDILIGGVGNDVLVGGGGDDTYVFNRGDGQDTVDDLDQAGGVDMLRFGDGIIDTDVLAFKSGNDLLLKIKGNTDQITFANYYAADAIVENETVNHKVNLGLRVVEHA